ncbi:hypothetical protein GEV33_002934 [Tenebrio molitor]|uniref:DDE Tnp4 domain-containing protein n=1 Tax=Tenebrio molitor TaxID=7067 RepID=A0A8J6HSI6_TENMO|nr:hypothetical protein GEV33_002934 [Tenebrio molitor]
MAEKDVHFCLVFQKEHTSDATLWELGDIQEVVGLSSKFLWRPRLVRAVSGDRPKPCSMRLWDVDVDLRRGSRELVVALLAAVEIKFTSLANVARLRHIQNLCGFSTPTAIGQSFIMTLYYRSCNGQIMTRSRNIPKKKDIMFSNLSTKDLAIVACILDEEEENSESEQKKRRRDPVEKLTDELAADCEEEGPEGISETTIASSYRLGQSTVQQIVGEVCSAIIKNMLSECIPTPAEAEWENIATKFLNLWDFPNCIGALDGKHVQIVAPNNTFPLKPNLMRAYPEPQASSDVEKAIFTTEGSKPNAFADQDLVGSCQSRSSPDSPEGAGSTHQQVRSSGDTPFSTGRGFPKFSVRGRTHTNDEPRSGRPKTATTPEIVDKIHHMVLADSRIKVHEIAEAVRMSDERVDDGQWLTHDFFLKSGACGRTERLPAAIRDVDIGREFGLSDALSEESPTLGAIMLPPALWSARDLRWPSRSPARFNRSQALKNCRSFQSQTVRINRTGLQNGYLLSTGCICYPGVNKGISQ